MTTGTQNLNIEEQPLREDQIEGILKEIPNPPGVGKMAIEIAKTHLKNRVRAVLDTIKLRPIQAAYEEFKEELIKSLYESHIEAGTAVGITAGVSLGGPVTQLSLNSFHFAGAQSGVALAFQKVRDFLTGSKMNRTPQMKVYFKTPYTGNDLHDTLHVGTFNSIMNLRHEFEQTMVSDVILDTPHILTREEAVAAGVPELIARVHSQLRPERFEGQRFRLTHVIELQLNTYRMFTHKITMAMVARAIEGPGHSNVPSDALTCVWRSQIDGRMYILINETQDYGQQAMSQEMGILMFAHRYVIRSFDQWKISGITGIISIEPQEVNVLKGIYRIRPSTTTPGNHYVYTNNRKTRWDGVSLADIHRLLTAAGFTVRPLEDKNKQVLYLTVINFEGNLDKELNRRISAAQEKPIPERNEAETALVNAVTFHYALTNGTNMEEIIWRDDIDLFRTVSNYSHEILEMLGIDAARIFLIYRFMQTLQEFGSYINPRHISLIFDLLCNLGIINSLSFVGINRRRTGPLATASYERSFDVFMNSSTYGDKEAIVGVSPSIYVGQRSKKVGTGSISIEEDLTVIPRAPPPLATIDEDTEIDDVMADEDIIEGTMLADIMAQEDIRQTRAMAVPIDKARIQATTRIVDGPGPGQESIIPAGNTTNMPNPILVKALQKVSINTGLTGEPRETPQHINPTDVIEDIGETLTDITSLEDISGLTLLLPGRFQPAPPPSTTGILSTLQAVPNTGIQISLPREVPERIGPSPEVRTPARIIDESVPILAPLPTVRVPRPPQVTAIETGSSSPASFISMLPDLSEITAPSSQRGNVQNISVANFLQFQPRAQ